MDAKRTKRLNCFDSSVQEPEKQPKLNGHASQNLTVCPEMAYYCFDSLIRHLNRQAPPRANGFSNDRYPLFVTWYASKNHHLRGCLGTFTPLNLYDGLNEYAISSGTRDSRFNPVTIDEVHNLEVSVSLLLNFEDANDYLDWEVGVHGIRIEFVNEKGRHKSATYLPSVAREQGWTRLQTIDSLLRKGGYREAITDELRNSIKLTRYKSEVITITYPEYSAYLSKRKSLTNGTA